MARRRLGKLRVDAKGRVTTSQGWAQQQGLTPGDEVDERDLLLRRKGYTRRAILRFIGLGTTGAALGFGADILDIASFIEGHVRGQEADQRQDKLLDNLIGANGAASIALMPARDHPFWPLPDGWVAYPIEGACMTAYADRFWAGARIRGVRGFPRLRDDDTVILFGSPISNQKSREHFGNPFGDEPVHCAIYGTVGEPLRVPLRWNVFSSAGLAPHVRQQYGVQWQTKSHQLIDFAESSALSVGNDGDSFTEDYLLVTAIPRFGAGPQRIVMFGGLHGPGTHGTKLLLEQPDMVSLTRLAKLAGRSPYFQALFAVSIGHSGKALVPERVTLLEACPLEV